MSTAFDSGEAMALNAAHPLPESPNIYMHNGNGALIDGQHQQHNFDSFSESSDELMIEPPPRAYNFQQLRAHFDDPCVYANLAEISKRELIEDIDRRPQPPIPTAVDVPVRIASNGWREYKTLGGRSYYFNPEDGVCQWKPPRNTITGLRRTFTSSECESPTSSSSALPFPQQPNSGAELFAEFPLMNSSSELSRSVVYGGGPHELGTICEGEPYPHQYYPHQHHNHHQSIVIDHGGDPEKDFGGKGFMSYSVDSASLMQQKAEKSNTNNVIEISPPGPPFLHFSPFPADLNTGNGVSAGKAICHGQLDKCKVAENGTRLKKRDWTSVYAYLYTGHLLFYKDQKSAEKTGKHYPPPSDVCDLRNAIVAYTENEREKRRKRLISLVLYSKTEYLFSCGGNESDLVNWFNALRKSITQLSPSKVYPHPIISDYCGSLHRSSARNSSKSTAKSTAFHGSIKTKLKQGSKSVSPNKGEDGGGGDHHEPSSRESIIERLLRFFRSRPTIEYLRERGIYKPEPVFGSTLAEITTHEKSLVPKFIIEVTKLIELKGLDSDGLYRVNGNLSAVQKIRCHVDQDKYDAVRNEEDVHVLTGALKLFLRELSEPVFPQSMSKEFMSAIREPNIKQRFRAIDELLLRLPPVNRETLKVIVLHLDRVATHSGKNRMQIHNLAIIFGPSLFCADERPNPGGAAGKAGDKGKAGKRKPVDKKGSGEHGGGISIVEPNQNLAYKMVVYGQIVEFILNEAKRLTLFKEGYVSSQQ